MLRFIVLLVLMCLSNYVNSQNCHWARVTSTPSDAPKAGRILGAEIFDDRLYTLGIYEGASNIGTISNPYVIQNSSTGPGHYEGMYMSVSDLNGNVLEAAVFDGHGGHFQFGSLTLDSTGNIYIAVTCWGKIDADPTAGLDILDAGSINRRFALYLKMNSNLDVLWRKSLGETNGGNSSVAVDVLTLVTDSDNSVYILGEYGTSYFSYDFDPNATVYEISPASSNALSAYLLKLDSTGVFQWVYQISSYQDIPIHDLTMDSDNNVYIAGEISGSGVDFDNSLDTVYHPFGTGGFVVKLDSASNFQWISGVVGRTYCVSVDDNNQVYYGGWGSHLAGEVYNDDGTTFPIPPAIMGNSSTASGFIVKLDTLGNAVDAINVASGFVTTLDMHNDTLNMSGVFHYDFHVDTGTDTVLLDAGTNSKGVLVRFDNSLNYQDYIGIESSSNYCVVTTIDYDDSNFMYIGGSYSGSIYFSSTFQNFGFPGSNGEAFQAKYDFNKNFASVVGLTKINEFDIYPNPTIDYLEFEQDYNVTKVCISNLKGYSVEIQAYNDRVELSLPSGVYHMKVFAEEAYIGEGRFVVIDN